jgi:lipoprotein-anchoring transpeptidase ErfK/SrfK
MDNRTFVISAVVAALLIIGMLAYRISAMKGPSPEPPVAETKTEDSTALLSEARKSISKGDDDATLAKLTSLIAKYPDSKQAETAYWELAPLYERRADFLKAREMYQSLIDRFPASDNTTKAQAALERVNIRILFSPIITPDSFIYEVSKGDTLAKIAKKFQTTIDLIMKANGLKDTKVRVGEKLKISKAKFSLVVDKSQNILTLKDSDSVVKTYSVSTGKDFSTPTGTFKIANKIIDPPWYTDGAVIPVGSPRNILGSRWLGLSKQHYGIHGTIEPESIGKQVTAGCVRMINADVEELYTIVPEGTEVTIVD